MLNILKNTINRVFASGVDSDASAFITATGLSGTTQKSAITTLVKDLKSSGLWSKMKAVYPMVTDNYNLLSYTEDITNGAWGKNPGALTTANTTTAPNGTTTADTYGNNGGVSCSIFQLGASNVDGIYTTSVYAKKGTNRYFKLVLTGANNALTRYAIIVDLNNGTLVSELNTSTPLTNKSYSIVDAGNGWYRLSVTATVPSSSLVYTVYDTTNSTSTTYNTSNLDYINPTAGDCYLWGSQIQLGSLTTYQPILTTPSAFMASQMKYNLKDARDLDAAFRLTWSGGWTYSATGATPNGTNAYADTKLVPSSVLTSINNLHLSHYSRTQNASVSGWNMGVDTTTPIGFLNLSQYFASVSQKLFNNGVYPTYIAQSNNTNTLGFAIGNVPSSVLRKLHFNGTILNTTTNTSNGNLPSASMFIGSGRNSTTGLAADFTPHQVAFSSIGDGLSDQDASLLNQIVEKYQVALSRGVQAAQSFYYNSAYSNEANTYLYSTQITGTTQVSAINTLINGLKANNLWSKMKAVYPFVTDKWNMLSYSEDFTNAAWSNDQASASANQTTAPDGTLTADKLIENTANNHHLNYQSVAASVGQLYTFSVYLKAAERQYASVQVADSTAGAVGRYTALIDLINGVILNTRSLNSTTNISNSITSVGNGWYRVSLTMTHGGGSSFFGHIATSNSATPSYDILDFPTYLGNGTSGIYIWGAQTQVGTLSAYQAVLGANNYSTNVAAQMKFNLVNPQDSDAAFRLAFSGGWTYSTNGAQPNGTNGYADTKINPSIVFGNRLQSFSLYTPISNSAANVLAGLTNGADTTQFYNPIGQFNIQTVAFVKSTQMSNGLVLMTATANDVTAFEKGVKLGSWAGTTYNAININYYIGARNNNSTADLYANRQYSFAHIGNTLTDAEAILFSQLIQQFQTDLSRQV